MSYPQGPQQGGYPQHPQPGPYGPPGGYPQYGGYPPPPPRKPKTGLIVGIVAAVVVLATLGITGFVAPGFFLGDDDGSGSDTSTAQGTAQGMVDAINAKNAAGVRGLKCANAEDELEQVASGLDRIKGVTLGQLQESGQTATAALEVDLGVAEKFNTTGQLANENGKWCWRAFDDSSASAGTTSAPAAPAAGNGAKPMMEEFLGKINDGDSTASAMVCEHAYDAATVKAEVESMTTKDMDLRLAEEPTGTTGSTTANVDGTSDGKPLASGHLAVQQTSPEVPWCVAIFYAHPQPG